MALLLTAAVYWQGLAGPILFDDYWNLAPVSRWHSNEQDWLSTLLPNQESIIFSRPVAMASFMLTTWLGGGADSFPLKLGNLVVHLLCGIAVWWLVRAVVRKDKSLSPHAEWLAVVLATIWLLHPLHVSTVLYAVQRMAQLSTLFTLLSVGVYVLAREQLSSGRTRLATINLLLSVPLLVAAGVLSKQNAAIAPFLCLVVEFAYFTRSNRDYRVLGAFYLGGVIVPLCAIFYVLFHAPERVMAGYDDLEFSLVERLMTQPRALVDYMGMWFLPRSAEMGLYTDDFPISTSLWSPLTTIPAVVFLGSFTLFAYLYRDRAPTFFAGWLFYLVAHGVESTFLPLEMYYEHRNYLPAIGLLLGGASLVILVSRRVAAERLRSAGMIKVAVLALVAVLTLSTLARVLVWQTEDAMTLQGMRHHPESIRVHLDRTSLALRINDHAAALSALQPLVKSANQRQNLVGEMDTIAIRCILGEEIDPSELSHATRHAQKKLTVNEVHVALLQEAITRNGACTGIPPEVFGDSLVDLLDAASDQPESAPNKSTIRRLAGQLYARAGRWESAQKQAEIGWKAAETMPLGSLLVRAYAKNKKPGEAAAVLEVMESKLRTFDNLWQAELIQLNDIVLQAQEQAAARSAATGAGGAPR